MQIASICLKGFKHQCEFLQIAHSFALGLVAKKDNNCTQNAEIKFIYSYTLVTLKH